MPSHKHCAKCDTTKPVSAFHRNRTTRDGLQTYCYPCMKICRRASTATISICNRRYREENREYVNKLVTTHRKRYQELSAQLATVPPGTPFTPEEDALLMADNGMTVYQKATTLGRTYNACTGRIDRNRKETTTP